MIGLTYIFKKRLESIPFAIRESLLFSAFLMFICCISSCSFFYYNFCEEQLRELKRLTNSFHFSIHNMISALEHLKWRLEKNIKEKKEHLREIMHHFQSKDLYWEWYPLQNTPYPFLNQKQGSLSLNRSYSTSDPKTNLLIHKDWIVLEKIIENPSLKIKGKLTIATPTYRRNFQSPTDATKKSIFFANPRRWLPNPKQGSSSQLV